MHSTMTSSLIVTCLAVAMLHSVTSAPVAQPMTSEDRQRLTEMITRLNNTLQELSAVLQGAASSSVVNQPSVEDLSSELPALAHQLAETGSSKVATSKQQEDETAEDEDDESDALSLSEVLQYLVQLRQQQQQQQQRHHASAVKRDHDIPFPLDDSYPSHKFRD